MRFLSGKLKEWVQSIAARFGYRLRLDPLGDIHPIDVRRSSNDPRALCYHSIASPVLIDAPLSRGFGLNWFHLAPSSTHPFIRAVRRGRESRSLDRVLYSTLSDYYRTVRPENASELLDIPQGIVDELDKSPPWARVFPWDSTSTVQRTRVIEEAARADTEQFGPALDISHGWKSVGPISDRLLQTEVFRLKQLLTSMLNNGYQRDDEPGGDVRATVLMKSREDWTWHVDWGGQHRAAVAAALGLNTIPVRVWRVVRLCDSDVWPNVNNGMFPRETAVALFRLVTSKEDYPDIMEDWVQGF